MGARRVLVALAGLLLSERVATDSPQASGSWPAWQGFGVACACEHRSLPVALIGARARMGRRPACVCSGPVVIAVISRPRRVSRELGVAAVAGLRAGAGPLLGGVLVKESAGRRVLVHVPVAILVVPGGTGVLPESTRPAPADRLVGVVLSILALGGVVFAWIEGHDPLEQPGVIASGVIGVCGRRGSCERAARANRIRRRALARPWWTRARAPLSARNRLTRAIFLPQYSVVRPIRPRGGMMLTRWGSAQAVGAVQRPRVRGGRGAWSCR